jgi:putative ABC transport system permease protein
MLPEDLIGVSVQGLKRNISRSLLTTLGIIIGVGSVVLMVSIGASFQQYILDQVSQFGQNTFEIQAKGLEQQGQPTQAITFGDVEAVRKLSTVQSVAPVIFVTERVAYGEEELTPFVFATTKELFDNWGFQPQLGRLFTDADIQSASNVAVLGGLAVDELFPNEDPIGKRITIGARKFTVVGVLEELGSPLAQTLDSSVYMPLSVGKSMMGSSLYVDYISLKSRGSNDLTKADLESLFRQRHSIVNPENDPEKDDVVVRSMEQAVSVISSVTLGMTIFLGLIAGISLLVGGIGIMNIMLVSVSERTKEIGLRKAVGAKKQDILLQFLLEAITLTVIGGLIGVLCGAGLAYLLYLIARQFLQDLPFALSMSAILLSVSMAAGTGLAFGIYPARKAANLSPMEALRWE